IETRYGMAVRVEADPTLISPDFAMDKFKTATRNVPEPVSNVVSATASLLAQIDDEDLGDEDEDDTGEVETDRVETQDAAHESGEARTESEDGDEGGRSKRRRRRRRRGGRGENGENGGHDSDAGDEGSDEVG